MPANESLWDLAVHQNKENLNIASGSQSSERTLLVIGSKSVGKSTLIQKFLDQNELIKPTLALEYRFGRKSGKSLVKDVCHIWELGGGTLFSTLLSAPFSSSDNLLNFTVILILDLSLPQQLWFTLENLLQALNISLRRRTSEAKFKQNIITLEELQGMAWERLGSEHEDKAYIDPFPIPLIIIGGKYDIFQNFDPEKKKVVCRSLRYIAHSLGATLFFYSSKDSGLIKKSKDIIGHYAFGSSLTKIISQDHNKPLMILSGSDSLNLIGGNIGGGKGALERWKHLFVSQFPQEVSERNVVPDNPSEDINFKEALIDSIRAQKSYEMDRYREASDRRNKMYEEIV